MCKEKFNHNLSATTTVGTSVGLVTEIKSAKEVVQEIEQEAIRVIMATHAQIKGHER